MGTEYFGLFEVTLLAYFQLYNLKEPALRILIF